MSIIPVCQYAEDLSAFGVGIQVCMWSRNIDLTIDLTSQIGSYSTFFRVHRSLPIIATICSPLTHSSHPFNSALQHSPCYPTEWIVPYDTTRHHSPEICCVTQPEPDHKGVSLHLLADYHEELIRASYEPSLMHVALITAVSDSSGLSFGRPRGWVCSLEAEHAEWGKSRRKHFLYPFDSAVLQIGQGTQSFSGL